MLAQKVLIKDNEIIKVAEDFVVDQYNYLDNSYIRIFLPKELHGEEQRFLVYKDGKISLDAQLKMLTLRAEKLQMIRAMRDAALTKLDHDIFKAEDLGQDAVDLRKKRQELRDMTEKFKDKDGKPAAFLDNVDLKDIKL